MIKKEKKSCPQYNRRGTFLSPISYPLPKAPVVKGELCILPGKLGGCQPVCTQTDCSRPGLAFDTFRCVLESFPREPIVMQLLYEEIIIYLTVSLSVGSWVVCYWNSTSTHILCNVCAGKFLPVSSLGLNNLNWCLQTTLQKMTHLLTPL